VYAQIKGVLNDVDQNLAAEPVASGIV